MNFLFESQSYDLTLPDFLILEDPKPTSVYFPLLDASGQEIPGKGVERAYKKPFPIKTQNDLEKITTSGKPKSGHSDTTVGVFFDGVFIPVYSLINPPK